MTAGRTLPPRPHLRPTPARVTARIDLPPRTLPGRQRRHIPAHYSAIVPTCAVIVAYAGVAIAAASGAF